MEPSSPDLEFLRSLKLLYVEDEADVREAMAHFLKRRFAKLDVAANGQEGLALFEQGLHDVVVTDIKMPVMDGLSMAAAIKAIMRDVPIIVVTAYNETEFFLRAIELGIDRYVKKPANPNEIIEAIEKSTQVHRQRQQLERANEHLMNTLQATIGALARAIEIRDPYTDGHQKRVSLIAAAIAGEMGLPSGQITGIRLGAMVHDIGKISVPTDLLTVPRQLSPLEFEFLKIHPQAGSDILADLDFPWPIAEMVRQHHERLDGSGYPRGLVNGSILLEARIISVADVFDAMASHRPYRPSLGVAAAVAEFEQHRSLLYDADIVDCFLRLLRRGELDHIHPPHLG